jgi:hypothetical protein
MRVFVRSIADAAGQAAEEANKNENEKKRYSLICVARNDAWFSAARNSSNRDLEVQAREDKIWKAAEVKKLLAWNKIQAYRDPVEWAAWESTIRAHTKLEIIWNELQKLRHPESISEAWSCLRQNIDPPFLQTDLIKQTLKNYCEEEEEFRKHRAVWVMEWERKWAKAVSLFLEERQEERQREFEREAYNEENQWANEFFNEMMAEGGRGGDDG